MQKDTIAIHAGYDKKSGNGEMAIPISQTTAYALEMQNMRQICLH